MKKRITPEQKAQLEALAKLPDDQVDTTDIPEVTFTDQAVRGRFYRPIKTAISIRIDADVLEWLKQSGPGYQGRINDILRREMTRRTQA